MNYGKKGVIVIAQSWPCVSYGGSIAVTASLRQYQKYFDSVVFICLNESEVGRDAKKIFTNVDFRQLKTSRGSFIKRYAYSLLYNKPAITMGIYKYSLGVELINLIKLELASNECQFVGIIEDNVPGVYLKTLKSSFTEMKWAFKSHDVLHKAFSIFKSKGNIIMRLAWQYEVFRIYNFEKSVVKLADFNWTITEDDLSLSEECYKCKLNGVMDASIDITKYLEVKPGLNTRIICLGSADSRKGHGLKQFVNKVWPVLLANHSKKIKLILGGKGTRTFNSQENHIDGHGYIEDEIEFLSNGAIFINPQMAGTGLKLKSLVAMASGKVLVTTKNGARGIGGINGEHYLVCDNYDDMATKLLSLLNDVQLQIKLAKAGRAYVLMHFSEIAFSNRVQPLLGELWNA